MLCDNDDMELWDQILEAYGGGSKKDGALKAVLSYVTAPREEELAGIRNYIVRRYGRDDVDLTTREGSFFGERLYDPDRERRDRLERQRKDPADSGKIQRGPKEIFLKRGEYYFHSPK